MPCPCRAPATMGAAMVMMLLQTGCTGTPFGDNLSRSFPAAGSPDQPASQLGAAVPAPQVNAAPTGNGSQPLGEQPPVSAAATKAQKSPLTPGAPKTAGGTPAPDGSQVRKSAPAAHPLPYRVTIRLPEADPSAPAEAVTKALRATGVAFEVETIERIASPGLAPLAVPAPTPGPLPESSAPAPTTTRPAPPPR